MSCCGGVVTNILYVISNAIIELVADDIGDYKIGHECITVPELVI